MLRPDDDDDWQKKCFCTCRMLFELLVLSGAQVGSDWTSILKKRQDFRLDYYVVITHMAQTLYIKDVCI
jgi:3-methyladenine DNA glycosylase Tag